MFAHFSAVAADRGIPKTWWHRNGYGSHAFMAVNAKGEKFRIKYHFKTDRGIECLTQAEADHLSARMPIITGGICMR